LSRGGISAPTSPFQSRRTNQGGSRIAAPQVKALEIAITRFNTKLHLSLALVRTPGPNGGCGFKAMRGVSRGAVRARLT
jgi:hypothetical protein